MHDHIILLLLITTGLTSPFPHAQWANASLKSAPASPLAHLRRGTLISHRHRRGLTLLFLSLSHRHPGFVAALRRPVQHLRLCVPAERQLPHQRTQELGVAQQRSAADRDPEEGKEEPARNRRGPEEWLVTQDFGGPGGGFDGGLVGEGDSTYRTQVKFSNSSVSFLSYLRLLRFCLQSGWDLTPGALQKFVFW